MSNMSYCRFENTLRNLRDCENAMAEFNSFKDTGLSDYEQHAFERLVKMCARIADGWQDDIA